MPFLGGWTLMMAAMMLPSAAPMVLLHRVSVRSTGALRSVAHSSVFVAGYLLVWASTGVVVWLAGRIAMDIVPAPARPYGVAVVLLASGVYQLTPLKRACLRACRTPADFLVTHWHGGRSGALRLGVAHGVYCLGCCWALMAVFAGAGAMGLVWALAIAAAVFAEKLLPRGMLVARVIGAALIMSGLVVAARPEIAGLPAGG